MAQINRYSRPAQVAKFDPMSAEEMMAVPLMKQQIEDQQMTDQRALLKDLYNTQAVQGDQARVNAKKDELSKRLEEIATDITTNGVSAKKTQAFNALKGEYDKEMSLSGEIGHSNAFVAKEAAAKKNFYSAPQHKNYSKADLDALWEAKASKMSGFNGDEFVQDYEEYGLAFSPTFGHSAGLQAAKSGSSVTYDKAGNAITSNEGQLKILSEQMRGNLLQEGTEEYRIAQQMGLDPINNEADYIKAANEIDRKLSQLAKTTGKGVTSGKRKKIDVSPEGDDSGRYIAVDPANMYSVDLKSTDLERKQEITKLKKEMETAIAEGATGLAEEKRIEIQKKKAIEDKLTERTLESDSGKRELNGIAESEKIIPQEYKDYVKKIEDMPLEELHEFVYKDIYEIGDTWPSIFDLTRSVNVKGDPKPNEEWQRKELIRKASEAKAESLSGKDVKLKDAFTKLKRHKESLQNLIDGNIGGDNAHYTTNMWSFRESGVAAIDKKTVAWSNNIKQDVKAGKSGYTITKGVNLNGKTIEKTSEEWRDLLAKNMDDSRALGFVPANAFNGNIVKLEITEELGGNVNTYTVDVEVDIAGEGSSARATIAQIFGNNSVEGRQLFANAKDHSDYKGIIPTIGDKTEEEGGYSSSDQILAHMQEGTVGKEIIKDATAAEIYRNPENNMFRFKWKNSEGSKETLTYGDVTRSIPWGDVDSVNKWIDAHPNVIASLVGEIRKTEKYKKAGEGLTGDEYKEAINDFYVAELRKMSNSRSSEAVEFKNHYNLMHILK